MFNKEDKKLIKVDVSKATKVLKLGRIRSPEESIEKLFRAKAKNSLA
jgi:hypothetical protein